MASVAAARHGAWTPLSGIGPAKHDATTVSTLITGPALGTVSDGVSILGITAVFAGAFSPAIEIAIALEGGKHMCDTDRNASTGRKCYAGC